MPRCHITQVDDPSLLPFAKSRLKAMRKLGLRFVSQQFDVGGSTVKVRIEGDDEYISVSGGETLYVRVNIGFADTTQTSSSTVSTNVGTGAMRSKLFKVTGGKANTARLIYSGQTQSAFTGTSTATLTPYTNSSGGASVMTANSSSSARSTTPTPSPAIGAFYGYRGKVAALAISMDPLGVTTAIGQPASIDIHGSSSNTPHLVSDPPGQRVSDSAAFENHLTETVDWHLLRGVKKQTDGSYGYDSKIVEGFARQYDRVFPAGGTDTVTDTTTSNHRIAPTADHAGTLQGYAGKVVYGRETISSSAGAGSGLSVLEAAVSGDVAPVGIASLIIPSFSTIDPAASLPPAASATAYTTEQLKSYIQGKDFFIAWYNNGGSYELSSYDRFAKQRHPFVGLVALSRKKALKYGSHIWDFTVVGLDSSGNEFGPPVGFDVRKFPDIANDSVFLDALNYTYTTLTADATRSGVTAYKNTFTSPTGLTRTAHITFQVDQSG